MFSNVVHNVDLSLIRHCKFKRWNRQACFNVDLTLPHVAPRCLMSPKRQNVETTFTFCKDVTQIWHRIIYFRNSKQYISPQEKLPLQSGGATVSDWHWRWRDDFRCNKCKHYKYCFVLAINKAIAKAIYIHTTILHGFLLL